MNARQAAEYRDELARRGIRLEQKRARKRTAKRKPKPLEAVPQLPPKADDAETWTQAELAVAARLLPHVCAESVIDRRRHALGVARMLLNLGVRR